MQRQKVNKTGPKVENTEVPPGYPANSLARSRHMYTNNYIHYPRPLLGANGYIVYYVRSVHGHGDCLGAGNTNIGTRWYVTKVMTMFCSLSFPLLETRGATSPSSQPVTATARFQCSFPLYCHHVSS